MEDRNRQSRLQGLIRNLDALVAFADEEEDFVLAAKLDDARVRFVDFHALPAS